MNKIFLIISREYLTRVRKKSFLIMTLLSPLIFAAMMFVPAWLGSQEDTEEKKVAIEDFSGLYSDTFSNTEYIKYEQQSDKSDDPLSVNTIQKGYDFLLVINSNLLENPSDIQIYSNGQITVSVLNNIKQQLKNKLKEQKLASYNIEGLRDKITELNQIKVDIQTIRIDEEGQQKESNTDFAIIIGIASALIIYMFMLIYGTQVMRGVIEEKTNRIIEVMISSVKPFQLMMGKIIGIGLVALTQFAVWIVLTLAITGIMGVSMGNKMAVKQQTEQTVSQAIPSSDISNTEKAVEQVSKVIYDSKMITILLCFLFYFIGGYLIYSALFAAIGSAIDNETETQQFVMPILLPLILSIYVASAVFKNPNGDIAFWFSMIPFTSPVVMMARIPFDVPVWELMVSMIILIATFITLTWFAARVYRTGILMYGKKVSYKEIWKWFLQAGR